MAFFGIGQQKPHHYLEMVRIVWENRDQLPFAWRILNNGVCDGCALGTSGLKDWTLEGPHLCMVRLELMRLNTAPALDPARLARVASLSGQTLRGTARSRPPSRADAARGRRAGLPGDLVGSGAGSDRARAAHGRSRAAGLLSHLAGHHERGLLRGAEGGAFLSARTTSTTRRGSVTRRRRRRCARRSATAHPPAATPTG